MSFSSVRIWNVFNFLCFLMRHLPTIVPKMPKKCLIHPTRPSSTVDFLEDDRRLYTQVRPNIARSLPYTRGHVPGGEKITEPGRGGYRGRGRSGGRRTGNFRDRETQERSINTRAFNLLIHTVTRASVAPTRWSATVWARWWSVPKGPFTKRNRPRISILEFQWV